MRTALEIVVKEPSLSNWPTEYAEALDLLFSREEAKECMRILDVLHVGFKWDREIRHNVLMGFAILADSGDMVEADVSLFEL